MRRILWKSEMESGIVEIDIQHRNLINIINILDDAIREKKQNTILKQIIDEVVKYSNYHIKTEERFFAELGFRDEEHLKQHIDFKESVKQFEKYDAEKILSFLIEWFEFHILIIDKKFFDFVKKEGYPNEL